MGIGVVRANDRALARVPSQGIAVSGVIELQDKLLGSRAREDIFCIVRIKGKSVNHDLLRRDLKIGFGFYFCGLRKRIGAVQSFGVVLHGVLDRRVGILPCLPLEHGIAVRTIHPVSFAERCSKGQKFLSRLRRAAGRRAAAGEIVAVGRT